jgi:LmbE family N-acetylglucosaminyl deacetylase
MSERDGLLLVHAHPDDECFSTGGLIARSIAEGRRVDLVVCTGGEEGEIHDPSLDADEARPRLAEIRSAELDCSVAALRGSGPGELRVHRLGYRDSGMMGSGANANPQAFWQADLDEAAARRGRSTIHRSMRTRRARAWPRSGLPSLTARLPRCVERAPVSCGCIGSATATAA